MLCSQLEKIHTLFRRQLGIPLLGKSRCTWGDGMDKLCYGDPAISHDYCFGRATQTAAVVFVNSLIGDICLSLWPLE